MRRIFAVLVVCLVVAPIRAEIHAPPPDPWPFGRITNADMEQLDDFAMKNGVNLKVELARAYYSRQKDR